MSIRDLMGLVGANTMERTALVGHPKRLLLFCGGLVGYIELNCSFDGRF